MIRARRGFPCRLHTERTPRLNKGLSRKSTCGWQALALLLILRCSTVGAEEATPHSPRAGRALQHPIIANLRDGPDKHWPGGIRWGFPATGPPAWGPAIAGDWGRPIVTAGRASQDHWLDAGTTKCQPGNRGGRELAKVFGVGQLTHLRQRLLHPGNAYQHCVIF